jgi:hypothetical protein
MKITRRLACRLYFGDLLQPPAALPPCSARGKRLRAPGAREGGDGDLALDLEPNERREHILAADIAMPTPSGDSASGQTPKIISLRSTSRASRAARSASPIGTIACRSSSAMMARAFKKLRASR